MATLEAWARPTDYHDLNQVPGGADHTYVVSSEGKKWECGGGTDGGSVIASGRGSHKLADKLSRNSCGGMVYGVTGVCHQMANRVLYPCGQNVFRAKGAGWSYTAYGIFGKPHSAWVAWRAVCEAETGRLPLPSTDPRDMLPDPTNPVPFPNPTDPVPIPTPTNPVPTPTPTDPVPIPIPTPTNPIPVPIPRIPRPRFGGFAFNPALNANATFEALETTLPAAPDADALRFSDDDWQSQELFSVGLLAEAARLSPQQVDDALFESFLRVRTDSMIADNQVLEVMNARRELEAERWKLLRGYSNGETTKSQYVKNYAALLTNTFAGIERLLGPALYRQIYDLPADHSPGIINIDAIE